VVRPLTRSPSGSTRFLRRLPPYLTVIEGVLPDQPTSTLILHSLRPVFIADAVSLSFTLALHAASCRSPSPPIGQPSRRNLAILKTIFPLSDTLLFSLASSYRRVERLDGIFPPPPKLQTVY